MIKNIGDYYLDLSKLKDISETDRDHIHSYYRDMLHYHQEKQYDMFNSFFNTLDMSGYLKNRKQEDREEKLELICD